MQIAEQGLSALVTRLDQLAQVTCFAAERLFSLFQTLAEFFQPALGAVAAALFLVGEIVEFGADIALGLVHPPRQLADRGLDRFQRSGICASARPGALQSAHAFQNFVLLSAGALDGVLRGFALFIHAVLDQIETARNGGDRLVDMRERLGGAPLGRFHAV